MRQNYAIWLLRCSSCPLKLQYTKQKWTETSTRTDLNLVRAADLQGVHKLFALHLQNKKER